MPILTPNTPFISKTPLISVDNKLAAGTFTFSLTVVDDSGNISAPAQLRVTVVKPITPDPSILPPELTTLSPIPLRARSVAVPAAEATSEPESVEQPKSTKGGKSAKGAKGRMAEGLLNAL